MDSPPSRRRAALTNLAHALFAGVLVALVHLSGLTLGLDKRTYDLWFQLSPTSDRPADHTAIVAIDDQSLQELGAWRWSSARLAALLQKIDEAAPAAIGLDIALDRARDGTDPVLERALAAMPHVVGTARLRADGSAGARPEVELPLRSFLPPERSGYSNALVDRVDGRIRSWRLACARAEGTLYSFPVLLALTASGRQSADTRADGASLWLPLRQGPPSQWPVVSPIDFRRLHCFPVVSAADVLQGGVPPEVLAGRVVLLGGTAAGEFSDTFQTPLSGDVLADRIAPAHGVEILANAVETLLSGIHVQEASLPLVAAVAILFVALACTALRPLRPVWGLLATGAMATGAAVVCLYLFATSYLQVPATPFVLGAATAYVTVALEKRAVAEAGRRLAEHRNALLRDLSAMVTHDLKGPLTSIIGFLGLLSQESLEDDQREYVQIALDSGRWLSVLVAGILDVAKMEAGQLTLTREPLDLAREMEKALVSVSYQLQGRDLQAEVSVAPDLPLVSADAEYFRRIIVNLVCNAAKFVPSGSTIRLRAKAEGGAVVVSVQDEGPGIAKEHQDRIFDKFVQVSKGKSAEQISVGLGLAFCRLAVEAHGGRIWVESEPGHGACFSFSLPAAPAPRG